MKLGAKLTAGFLAVALVLVAVAGLCMVLGQQASEAEDEMEKDNEALNEINALSQGLYQEHTLAIKYLTTDDPAEAEDIIVEKEALCDENEELYHHLLEGSQEMGAHPEFEEVGNKLEALNELFESYVEQENQALSNQSMSLSIAMQLESKRNKLNDNYIEDEVYKSALSQYVTVTCPETGEPVNKTARQLASELGQVEKEYTMLYKDAVHLNRVTKLNESLIEACYASDIPLEAKNGINATLDGYMALLQQYGQYVSALDSETLLAQGNDIYHELEALSQEIREDWLDNPAYGDMFYVYRIYDAEGVSYYKSLDHLYYELKQRTIDLSSFTPYADQDTVTYYYTELSATITESKAYIDVIGLEAADKAAFKNLYDIYLDMIDALKKNQRDILLNQVQLQYGTALQIAALDELIEELMIGNGPEDEAGLDYITADIQKHVEEKEAEAESARQLANIVTIAGAVAAIILAVVLGVRMSRSISKLVVDTTDPAGKVGEGNPNVSVDENGGHEIVELNKTLDQMVMSAGQVGGEIGIGTPSETKGVEEPGLKNLPERKR